MQQEADVCTIRHTIFPTALWGVAHVQAYLVSQTPARVCVCMCLCDIMFLHNRWHHLLLDAIRYCIFSLRSVFDRTPLSFIFLSYVQKASFGSRTFYEECINLKYLSSHIIVLHKLKDTLLQQKCAFISTIHLVWAKFTVFLDSIIKVACFWSFPCRVHFLHFP